MWPPGSARSAWNPPIAPAPPARRRRGRVHACRAVDFRVRARTRGVMAYLSSRPEVGGLKVYGNGIIHIDNGSRRRW